MSCCGLTARMTTPASATARVLVSVGRAVEARRAGQARELGDALGPGVGDADATVDPQVRVDEALRIALPIALTPRMATAGIAGAVIA